ncbi:MAG: hypothetical protein IPL79_18645 [Myxococcales bacterium]|nr:hypothetical protein [Myxococcales bacterium]
MSTPAPARRRRNSLIDIAASLPNIDASLDAFIAKVNATDANDSNWNLPKASDAANQTIAEMQAAHALELERIKHRLSLEAAATEKKLEANSKKVEALSAELAAAQAELATRPAGDGVVHSPIADVDFEMSALRQESRSWQERARTAEKNAGEQQAAVALLQTKLSATANDLRAAQANATIATPAKKPWLAIGGAFVGGAVISFALATVMGGKAPAAAAIEPATVKAIAAPEVTPLPAPAKAAAPVAEEAIAAPAAAPVAAPAVEAEPQLGAPEIEVEVEPAAAPIEAPAAKAKPAAKASARPASRSGTKPAAKPASGGKKAGGIVDPF